MAYKLTPADRRARTELMRQQRDTVYRRQKEREELKRLEAANAASDPDSGTPKKESNGFVTALHTVGDVGANVAIGAGKGVEGIVDLFAGIGGGIAGIFSEEAQNNVKKWIAKDHTGELYGNAWQAGLDQSALNNSKVGQIIEGVAQGVGQMLPAVLVTVATGGAAAPAVLQAASQGLGFATMVASAAGSGTEQAFAEGAGYGQGLAYGAATGAIEGVTEKLTGGVTKAVFGKGMLDDVVGGVLKTGAGRVAKDAVGEGVEEMASEVLGQGAKAIYKGTDAFKEYGESDFWAGVGEAGIIGAGTSVAYGGTVGHLTKTSGTYADARSVMEHIDTQESRIADGDLSVEQEVQARKNIKADYEVLSRRLMRTSENTRANVLKNPQLAAAFDADGTLKADFAAQLDADMAAVTDSTYDHEHRSSTLSAAEIDGVVQKAAEQSGREIHAFTGKLTEAQRVQNKKLRQVMGRFGQRSGGKVRYFLAENVGENGFIDPDTGIVAIDMSALEHGKAVEQLIKGEISGELWLETAIHETGHATEGTASHVMLSDHLVSNDAVFARAVADFIERGYFGEDTDAALAKLNDLLEKEKRGAELTEREQRDLDMARSEIVAIATERVLSNADFVKRLVKGEPRVAERILNKIVQIKNALTGNGAANAEIAFLRKAERMYLQAIDELGGTYRDGKIYLPHDEEDESVIGSSETVSETAESVSENGETVSPKEKSPAKGELKVIRFSRMNHLSLNENVERILLMSDEEALRSKEDGEYISIMPSTPSVVTKYVENAENLEIVMRFDAFYLATRARGILEGHYHNYGDVMKTLPEILANPLAIVRMDNNRINFLATVPHPKGNNNVVSLELNTVKDINSRYKKYNLIVTVTPAKDNYVRNILGKRAVKVEYQKEDLSQVNRQLYEWLAIVNDKSSNSSLHPNEPIVKPATQENSGEIKLSRKATAFTHRDVNEILSSIRTEALTFTLEDGTEIEGKIVSRDGLDLSKRLYDILNSGDLRDKRALARQITDQILDVAITQNKQSLREAIGEEATALVREDLALSVAAALGEKQAQIENRRKNEYLDIMRKIAEEMRDVEKGRFYSATIYDGDTLRVIPNMLRAALKTSRAFTGSIRNTLAKVKEWYCADGNTMMYKPVPGEHNEGMANGQVVFDKDIAAMLEQLTTGEGELSVQELEMVVDIAKHFQKLSERYQKVFINGKWVDAEQMAEEFVSIMQTAQKEQTWIVRGLLNKYMRQFGDPAALFRAMDAYNPNGFYTKMHEWMRNAAISMQSDELHALKEYYEWHEKHKKWAKHLENDLIEFRGKKMTVGQFMTLYCESKTEKSKQGLADNGFKFTDKDGVPHRIKGLIYEQGKGERASRKHSREEVQRACKQLENEIWNMLSEEQRAYIKLLENVLNTTCRKWKIDTDTLMKGFSRVRERGYYFPSAHNGIAKTVDTTFYEGDRVGHLSLNKETVEGARGELIIDSIDNVVLRHVRNMALYKNYAIVAENHSMLQNIDVGSVDGKGERIKNVHQAVTIRTTSEEYGKYRGTDIMKLLDKMSSDLQGGKRAGQDEQSFLKNLVEEIRGNYARFQLGFNPKTLVTQLTSLIAAGNILEYKYIARFLRGFVSKKTAQLVDKYCPLAELRNFDNTAAEASGLLNITGKHIGDKLMKGIGFVDRRVVCSLFYACQLQVQKDSKLTLGSEENLKAAGELLTRVILETQQNSLVTEKSDAMRGGIFSRTFTMFTADGMKVIGRWFDSVGEWSVVSKHYRDAKRAGNTAEVENLEKELKRVRGQFLRSTSALTVQAVCMALISYLFRLLYDKDEEEVGENVAQGVVDFIGGLIGGLPIFRDIFSFFSDGYELDNFFLSTVNDVLVATSNAVNVAQNAISGKEVSRQDVASAVRKVVYSSGQVLGIPVRNAYNFVTGLTRRFIPTAGYAVDSLFTARAYASDLEKAIEAGDEDMAEMISGLMIDEKIHLEDEGIQKMFRELVGKGYSVLPRSVGDKVSMNGTEIALSGKQQKRFRELYRIGDEAVTDMVKLRQFSSADEKVQAKAVQFIYDVYWELALESVTGEDLAERNVLFAEAIPIEKLAIIIATARAIEADKDKDGKAISGTKKRKVQTFVNSLHLTAAQKYMVMGYLGYSNLNGEEQVTRFINKLNLSKYEKTALREYCGYELSQEDRAKMYQWTQKSKYAPYGGQDPNDPDRISPK